MVAKDIAQKEVELRNILPKNSYKIVKNQEPNKTNFKIQQAKEVITEANISTQTTRYIVLIADKYEIQAQNSLLKILEEPPKNIVFVIVTNLKTALIPTVLSRLQVVYDKTSQPTQRTKTNIHRMDISQIYNLLQTNKRATKEEVKSIITDSLFEQKTQVAEKILHIYESSIKLLELNSRPINILSRFCLALFMEKKSANI